MRAVEDALECPGRGLVGKPLGFALTDPSMRLSRTRLLPKVTRLRDAQRKEILRSRLLVVHGKWQREGDVKNLIAGKLEDPDVNAGQTRD